jgi:hypothetical protein
VKLLKEKKVKKCICGKEPTSKILRTEWNQVLAVLLLLMFTFFFAALVAYPYVHSLGEGSFFTQDTIILSLIAGAISINMGYHFVKLKGKGHSYSCSVRYAFFKVTENFSNR